MVQIILFLFSTAGFEFTGLPGNAREAALANTLPSPFFKSIPSNPAGILIEGRLFNLNYINYLAGIQYGSLAAVNSKRDIGYSTNLFYFTSGSLVRTDEEGKRIGNFSFSSFSLSLSAARKVIAPISIGGSLKFLHSRCDTFNSSGMAVDVGVLFAPARAKVGFLLKNLGWQFSPFYKEKDRFPTTFRGEAGYLIFDALFINLGLEKFADEPLNFNFGAEASVKDILFLRGSYSSLKDDLKTGSGSDIFANFALGLSVKKDPLRLDYSFSPFLNLGNAHFFSLFFLR